MSVDASVPLCGYVLQRIPTRNGKSYEYDMCLRVSQWSQPFVVFLASGVPESELDGFAVDAAVGDVVFEDSWDVSLDVMSALLGCDL